MAQLAFPMVEQTLLLFLRQDTRKTAGDTHAHCAMRVRVIVANCIKKCIYIYADIKKEWEG